MSTRWLMLSSILLLSSICAAADDKRPPTDEEITAQVSRVLTTDNETKANKINVQTRGGIVQLSGFIESGRMSSAATTAARSVHGVKEVRNDLIVREGERTLAQGGEDSVIAAKVQKTLDGRSQKSDDVDVHVRGGVVQLTGFVASQDRKTEAERVARAVDGVTEVRNDINVANDR
jgi:hyperosmotically inducible periplasmic protein